MFFLGLAFLIFLSTGYQAAQADTPILRFVTGNDYKPYTDENLPGGGMHTEIVRRAFDSVGVKIQVEFLPWKRGYNASARGDYDGTFSYSRLPDREALFAYSEPFYFVENRLFVSTSSEIKRANLSNLIDKAVCVPIGYAVPGVLGTWVQDEAVRLERPPSMGNCFSMLLVGNVDAVYATLEQGMGLAVETFGTNGPFQILPEVLYSTGNHLIVSRTHPRSEMILNAFNTGLSILRSSGELETIVQRHRLGYRQRIGAQ